MTVLRNFQLIKSLTIFVIYPCMPSVFLALSSTSSAASHRASTTLWLLQGVSRSTTASDGSPKNVNAYLCHQNNFLCRNGDINEELLSVDGLHLSKLGTERLISNLKLSSSASCRIGRSQRPGGDPQRPKPWTTTPASRTQAPGAAQPRRHQDRVPASHPSSVNDRHATTGGRGYFQRNHGSTERGPKTNFGINNSTYSNYCQFCGEGNHRHHVCRFGMPVVCYRCHKGGHKEKFCDFYHQWNLGKEEGHIIKIIKSRLLCKSRFYGHSETRLFWWVEGKT